MLQSQTVLLLDPIDVELHDVVRIEDVDRITDDLEIIAVMVQGDLLREYSVRGDNLKFIEVGLRISPVNGLHRRRRYEHRRLTRQGNLTRRLLSPYMSVDI